MKREHRISTWIATLLVATSLSAQIEYRAYVAEGRPSKAALEAIKNLDGVDAAFTIGINSDIKLVMKEGAVPDFDQIQKILGHTRIWSLRRADTMNPVEDLVRSAAWMRENGGMKKADVDYMVQRDPRTKRRLLVLAVLGQIRDVYRVGTKTRSEFAGNQKLLGLLPLIGAHIATVRARGYKVDYKPLKSDAGILNAIADTLVAIREKKLRNGLKVASKDSRLRHMYSHDKNQKLIQRQIELAFRHYRSVMIAIVEESDKVLKKLADRPKTDPVRVKYQALRTTAVGLQLILK